MSNAQTSEEGGIVARDLTAFQYNILVVLSREPMYGLAIKAELEAYYLGEVNHGRLYPNLDELVKEGLVSKSELDKRTNEYALTDDGYDALVEYLEWLFGYFVNSESRADELQEIIDDSL